MSEKQNNIFDVDYVGASSTNKAVQPRNSDTKEFLKAPISEYDIERYGTSKPHRIVIHAVIQNGKSN